jgi:hypothetical protein
MKFQWKKASLLVALCILGCSCGDIIKVRNPTKKVNTPEPETKTSALYGSCTNFQGRWTVRCETPVEGTQTSFFLVQQYCDFFILQGANRSFEGDTVAWSDARDGVTLRQDAETFVLVKRDGARQGTWTRREKSCSMSWSAQ